MVINLRNFFVGLYSEKTYKTLSIISIIYHGPNQTNREKKFWIPPSQSPRGSKTHREWPWNSIRCWKSCSSACSSTGIVLHSAFGRISPSILVSHASPAPSLRSKILSCPASSAPLDKQIWHDALVFQKTSTRRLSRPAPWIADRCVAKRHRG